MQIKRVGAGPVEADTESCRWSVPQGVSQAGMVVKNPKSERGGTCSIFCGYQRILHGGSKRNVYERVNVSVDLVVMAALLGCRLQSRGGDGCPVQHNLPNFHTGRGHKPFSVM
jgi:hypothetical protein